MHLCENERRITVGAAGRFSAKNACVLKSSKLGRSFWRYGSRPNAFLRVKRKISRTCLLQLRTHNEGGCSLACFNKTVMGGGGIFDGTASCRCRLFVTTKSRDNLMRPRAPVSTGRSPTSVRRIPTAAAGVLGGASAALVEGHLVVLTCLNGGGSRRGGLRTVYRDSLECVDPVSPLPSFVRPRAPLLRPPPLFALSLFHLCSRNNLVLRLSSVPP